MNSSQFDTMTRLFADRRATRRAALAAGAGFLAAGLSPAAAQDASPVAVPAGSPAPSDTTKVPFMFVQTLGAGSLVPKEGEEGTLILSADELANQTIFFSDRPSRIVGMMPTDRFLGTEGSGGLGFSSADPPNAALVLAGQDQSTEIVVVELISPTYDAGTGAVTYEVRVLDAFDEMDLALQQEPLTAADAARDFTAASLFIDDCADGTVTCWNGVNQVGASSSMGFCYDYDIRKLCCQPCQSPATGSWAGDCNSWFSECDGNCTAGFDEGYSPSCPAS